MLTILDEYGTEDLAKVYIAFFRSNNKYLVEFVESIQPPFTRDEKWVLIVSTLFGCPIRCKICDAGSIKYHGRLTADEILEEIDFMVRKRYPDGIIPIPKFKIQFARMGDPALNTAVITVLKKLPLIYNAPGILPSISTVAPKNSKDFLYKIIDVKNKYYKNGMFQLQFSIHTTDMIKRNELIPTSTLSFDEIAEFGKRFFNKGDKKVTLNFAMCNGYPVDTSIIRDYFDPDYFIIKLTPINPTYNVASNEIVSTIDAYNPTSANNIIKDFKSHGFNVILSIGEVEENKIGSNCGQFITKLKKTPSVL
jgi:23S rRNA (adenine2503-C2)-methyltransferase